MLEVIIGSILTIGLILPILILIIFLCFKVVYQYERGVKLTLGKFSGIMEPGLRIVIPIIQSWTRVDMRLATVDVPEQDTVTKDNISVKVNAVLYYRVEDPKKAILKVEDFAYAVAQLAQTTMRDIVGEVTLDHLLGEREQISLRIKEIVARSSAAWGVKVENVDLKDIVLPTDLVRVMAKEAESERERRAVIIKAGGEVIASQNMQKAAVLLGNTPGALHLRTLHSLNDISSDPTNTISFFVPLEILKALEGYGGKKK